MKLKKFNLFEKREGFDDIYEPLYPKKEWNSYDDDDYDDDNDDEFVKDDNYNHEDDESSDDMDHLCYLLRQMIYNSGIYDVSVQSSGLDISISVQFNRKEQLKDIVKIFGIIKKIKKDILAQYEDSFEMWETKSGNPVITFDFILDDSISKDNDYPW
jgi:hypothetical protein